MQNSDKEFISLMYDHYADSLFGIVIRIMKNDTTAKNVMKDGFLKVWKNHKNYQAEKTKLFTWLLQIFRKTAIEHLRKDNHTVLDDWTSNLDLKTIDKSLKKHPDLFDLGGQLNIIYFQLKEMFVSISQKRAVEVYSTQKKRYSG